MSGIDIVYIEKFRKKLNKNNFLNRIFTEGEIKYSSKKNNMVETLAGIYAAKEAAIKSYSLKLSHILRKRIEIKHQDNKPYLYIDLKKMNADISITHEGDYAVSICIDKENNMLDIDQNMKTIFPKREPDSHKGSFGKIAIIGGSEGMAGSVFMSSLSAMRTGAGLTYILAPSSISQILEIKCSEQIIKKINCDKFTYDELILRDLLSKIKDMDVLAIGPGMGTDPKLYLLIAKIISNFKKNIVIDADGLNALSKDISILDLKKDIVLTPHLMEFSRLSRLSIEEINDNREEIAINFAKEKKVILVLKSNNTIVTDGDRIYINKIGNPGMATAGSGDVLTGIIASLLKRLDPYQAACLSVYIHSLSGDIAKSYLGEDSIIATDIIKYIPDAMNLLR